MREIDGDLWEIECAARVITTNGVTKADGDAIMGAGVALQAKQRYPWLPGRLGKLLQAGGNHVYVLGEYDGVKIISFPTKRHWRENSDLELIRQSCRELRALKLEGVVAMPRPGCKNGGLGWAAVRPVVQEELPEENFVVVQLG